MEYFYIELIYQHLKDNYPKKYHTKFCYLDKDSITIFSKVND
jgi:hypothetical protein